MRSEMEYEETEAHDFQNEPFIKCVPQMKLEGIDNPCFTNDNECCGPPMRLTAVNHLAIGCQNVDALGRFYTKLLGFKRIPRPDLGFAGACAGQWLKGLGIMLHIIEYDPTVPHRHKNWKDLYESEPEAWFIRRGSHLALEVEDFEAAEEALRRHGVEYSRHVLPDAGVHQLFFFDPEGNGVEIGIYDKTAEFLEKHGEEGGWQ